MDMQKEAQIESLLYQLLEILSPDNETITTIKKEDEQAKEDIKKINEENPKLEKQIEEYNEILKLLEEYSNDHTELGEKSINLIEKVEGLTYKFDKYVAESRAAYERYQEQLEEAKKQTEENEKRLSEANEIISETPAKLKDEHGKIDPLNTSIHQVLSGEVKYLSPERVEDMLKKLGIFSSEEIQLMIPAICFPDTFGFRAIHFKFNNSEEDKTKIGDVINRAFRGAEEEEKNNIEKTKVTDVSPLIEEKTNSKIEYLEKEFGISAQDIECNPQILDVPLDKLQAYKEELKRASIDLNSIRQKTITKESITRLIENITVFAEAGYELDEMTIRKEIGALDSNDPVATKKAIALISESGLTLRKPNGMIAVEPVTKELSKLRNAIKLAAAIDITYFSEHPENLSAIVSDTLARILYCQQNGINYKDSNGNFESFVKSAKEWQEIYSMDVDETILPLTKETTQEINEKISPEATAALKSANDLDNFISSATIRTDKEDLYNELTQTIAEINTSENPLVIEIEGYKFLAAGVNKNLIYLLNADVPDTKENIILSSLVYRNPVSKDAIKDLKVAINPNTRGISQR